MESCFYQESFLPEIKSDNLSFNRANDLIRATVVSNQNEYKMILYALTKINQEDRNLKQVNISVKEFAEVLGVSKVNIYRDFHKYEDNLRQQYIKVKRGKIWVDINWFSHLIYTGTELELFFNPNLTIYLTSINLPATRIFYKNIKKLDSMYAIRTYELLKMYEDINCFCAELPIEEYRKYVGAEDSFSAYSSFKSKVLEKSEAEINKKTDIKFAWEGIKTGKRIATIRFTIENGKQRIVDHNNLINYIQKILNETVSFDEIQDLINSFGQEHVEKYIYKVDLNKLFQKDHPWNYLKSCILNNYENFLIGGKSKKSKSAIKKKVPQELNYEQRSYDDEFYKSLYHNK